MNIINLTPHTITFVDSEGNPTLVVQPSGKVARVTCRTVTTGEVDGIPITETVYGEIEGLPAPSIIPYDTETAERETIIYIVSSLVAQRCKNRTDVFIPNESVRDSEGRIIGCRSLGKI